MRSDEWWQIFREASELRKELERAEKELAFQQLATARRKFKRATEKLLVRSEIPQPLRMLVIELWGGAKATSDPWPGEKWALHLIEAQQPRNIGYRKLAKLLNDQENTSIDPTQIKRWRNDPEYQYLVARQREERDLEQGDTPSE